MSAMELDISDLLRRPVAQKHFRGAKIVLLMTSDERQAIEARLRGFKGIGPLVRHVLKKIQTGNVPANPNPSRERSVKRYELPVRVNREDKKLAVACAEKAGQSLSDYVMRHLLALPEVESASAPIRRSRNIVPEVGKLILLVRQAIKVLDGYQEAIAAHAAGGNWEQSEAILRHIRSEVLSVFENEEARVHVAGAETANGMSKPMPQSPAGGKT